MPARKKYSGSTRKRAPKRKAATSYRRNLARNKKKYAAPKKRSRTGYVSKHRAPVATGTGMGVGKRGPAGVGYAMQQVSDTCTRITGRAYIGEINTKGKVPTGSTGNCLGLMFDINPALLNDRVAVIASTFEKYVYHGMKFTYIPQCATTARGSVGLVFDRDPLQISANTQGVQFLSEVMSYEHAVLTPGYVEASTVYARDPKELKTWYISSPDATLTTRDTSQGNLLVYMSNVDGGVGYGFLVMDYVLDLVTPNLLPSKQNVIDTKSAPSQWRDFAGVNGGGSSIGITTFTPVQSFTLPVGPGTGDKFAFWANSQFLIDIGGAYTKPGAVGEFMFGGLSSSLVAAVPTLGGLSAPTFVTADNVDFTPRAGSKIYFCVHVYNSAPTGSDFTMVSFHTTVSSARSAAASSVTAPPSGGANVPGATTTLTFPDQLFAPAGGPSTSVSGWLRMICDGAGVVNNA